MEYVRDSDIEPNLSNYHSTMSAECMKSPLDNLFDNLPQFFPIVRGDNPDSGRMSNVVQNYSKCPVTKTLSDFRGKQSHDFVGESQVRRSSVKDFRDMNAVQNSLIRSVSSYEYEDQTAEFRNFQTNAQTPNRMNNDGTYSMRQSSNTMDDESPRYKKDLRLSGNFDVSPDTAPLFGSFEDGDSNEFGSPEECFSPSSGASWKNDRDRSQSMVQLAPATEYGYGIVGSHGFSNDKQFQNPAHCKVSLEIIDNRFTDGRKSNIVNINNSVPCSIHAEQNTEKDCMCDDDRPQSVHKFKQYFESKTNASGVNDINERGFSPAKKKQLESMNSRSVPVHPSVGKVHSSIFQDQTKSYMNSSIVEQRPKSSAEVSNRPAATTRQNHFQADRIVGGFSMDMRKQPEQGQRVVLNQAPFIKPNLSVAVQNTVQNNCQQRIVPSPLRPAGKQPNKGCFVTVVNISDEDAPQRPTNPQTNRAMMQNNFEHSNQGRDHPAGYSYVGYGRDPRHNNPRPDHVGLNNPRPNHVGLSNPRPNHVGLNNPGPNHVRHHNAGHGNQPVLINQGHGNPAGFTNLGNRIPEHKNSRPIYQEHINRPGHGSPARPSIATNFLGNSASNRVDDTPTRHGQGSSFTSVSDGRAYHHQQPEQPISPVPGTVARMLNQFDGRSNAGCSSYPPTASTTTHEQTKFANNKISLALLFFPIPVFFN